MAPLVGSFFFNVKSTNGQKVDVSEFSITESSAISTNFVNFARQKLNVHLEPYDISANHDLPALFRHARQLKREKNSMRGDSIAASS